MPAKTRVASGLIYLCMMSSKLRINLIPGLCAGVLMIILFILIRNAKPVYLLYAHFFNLAFVLAAIVYSVRKQKSTKTATSYLQSFLSAMITTAIASLVFNGFLLLYLYFINPVYYLNQISYAPLGEYMNGLVICVMFFAEAMSAGLIFTLIVLQFYKNAT